MEPTKLIPRTLSSSSSTVIGESIQDHANQGMLFLVYLISHWSSGFFFLIKRNQGMLFLVYLISHWSSGFFFFKVCIKMIKWWFMTSTCSMLVCLYQIRPIFRQNFSFRPRAITETQHCSGDDEVIISIRCVSRNITHQAKFSLNSVLRICNRRQHMQ